MIGGKIADGGGGIAYPVAQAEEYSNTCFEWEGCGGLRPEVGYGLTADGIFRIVKGDDNLCGIAEMIGGGVPGEEKIPYEEHKAHEGPELDRTAVAGAIRVFKGLEAEVEDNCDQVGDVVGYEVGGSGCCGDDGVNDSQGDCLL